MAGATIDRATRQDGHVSTDAKLVLDRTAKFLQLVCRAGSLTVQPAGETRQGRRTIRPTPGTSSIERGGVVAAVDRGSLEAAGKVRT
ncbi:MAG: hypothetical protein NT013_08060 [Planctomycetia bacterium]|nr:hypothetical protein [Planctomycetia bacterium]